MFNKGLPQSWPYQGNALAPSVARFLITFNGSKLCCLFPERLPVYMYSLRRGVGVKPLGPANTRVGRGCRVSVRWFVRMPKRLQGTCRPPGETRPRGKPPFEYARLSRFFKASSVRRQHRCMLSFRREPLDNRAIIRAEHSRTISGSGRRGNKGRRSRRCPSNDTNMVPEF